MQIGEGVSLGMPLVEGPDKCPICLKEAHKTTKAKEEGKGEYKSIPKNLGCTPIPKDPTVVFYSTAAHHLIPAEQCLLKFHRLSQMAYAVGYDVNAKKNGLSLPAVGQLNENSYFVKQKKYTYGKLGPADKKEVAYEVMDHVDSLPKNDGFGAQWHVGHHDWSFETAKELLTDTDDISHARINYEGKVNENLRKLEKNFTLDKSICEPDEDDERGKKIQKNLDELSDKIRKGIRGWKNFYVSAMAYTYAIERK